MYYDQNSNEQQQNEWKNSSKTMEMTTQPTQTTTTQRSQRTTSKTLLTEDALRKSGVSQKILQKLPAYIVEQSMNKLNEAAEQLDSGLTGEISMPLIQLTKVEAQELEPVKETEGNQIDAATLEERIGKIKAGRKGFLFKADAVVKPDDETLNS